MWSDLKQYEAIHKNLENTLFLFRMVYAPALASELQTLNGVVQVGHPFVSLESCRQYQICDLRHATRVLVAR